VERVELDEDVVQVKECEGRNTCLRALPILALWPEYGTDGVLGGVVSVDFKGRQGFDESDAEVGGAVSSTCGWAKMEFDAVEEFEGAKKKFKWPDARKTDKLGSMGSAKQEQDWCKSF
jgi:hypothetical protein